jgi:hypothetical protein
MLPPLVGVVLHRRWLRRCRLRGGDDGQTQYENRDGGYKNVMNQ